jgi:ABC-type polysaccharide/polyol phosphate export permease
MNPLVLMLVLTFVFTKIGHAKDPFYPLYVLSGILCWNAFAQSLLNGSHSIPNNGGLLRKVKVPQWIFPSVSVFSSLVNMTFALFPFAGLALVLGLHISINLLLLPVLLLLFLSFLLGLVLIVSTVNVLFRDVGHMLESGMLILFYSAPIAYPIDMIHEKYRFLLALHPIFYFLKGFRTVLCSYPVVWSDWLAMGALSLLALAIGAWTHRALKDRIYYYL